MLLSRGVVRLQVHDMPGSLNHFQPEADPELPTATRGRLENFRGQSISSPIYDGFLCYLYPGIPTETTETDILRCMLHQCP